MRLVAKGFKTPHHFTLPYTPWSNGSVERLGKELIGVFWYTGSEFKIRLDEWYYVLLLVQSALNNALYPSRGNIAPLTAFTGMKHTPPISTFLLTETVKPVTVTELQRQRCFNVNSLVKIMKELHPVVQDTVRLNRKQSLFTAARGILLNFTDGYFVLVSREEF